MIKLKMERSMQAEGNRYYTVFLDYITIIFFIFLNLNCRSVEVYIKNKSFSNFTTFDINVCNFFTQ